MYRYGLLCLKDSKLVRIRKIIPDPDLDLQTLVNCGAQYPSAPYHTNFLYIPTACYGNTVSVHLIHVYPAKQ
jgi:hypothetical protein